MTGFFYFIITILILNNSYFYTVKIFTCILAIYILILTAIPCCAYDKCENDKVKTEKSEQKNKNKQEDKGCCGSCSPFFCHSCSGFIIVNYYYPIAIKKIHSRKTYNIYHPSILSQYFHSLWQPPDVA